MPVMVTVAVRAAALLAAVKVTTLLFVAVLAGLKLAVTPVGRPAMVSATVPVKPFNALMAMVLATFVPGAIFRLAGVGETVKPGAAATVTAIVALLAAVPRVPVTVTVEVPGAAFAAAVKVSALVRAAVAGLNAAVTPVGRPATESATVPLNPVWGTTVMVLTPPAPCRTERLAGDAAIV